MEESKEGMFELYCIIEVFSDFCARKVVFEFWGIMKGHEEILIRS